MAPAHDRIRLAGMYTRDSELADSMVQDLDGNHVRLGDFWKDQPVVLAFVRHFG